MSEILFARRPSFASLGNRAEGDLLVSCPIASGGKRVFSVRIHEEALRRLSWMIGDHITVGVDGGRVLLKRVSGPQDGGVRIAPVGGGKRGGSSHGVARFSASEEVLAKVLPDGKKFRASLAEAEGGQALFIKD